MSWITIAWSMAAAACLTLATIYLFVWWNQRRSWHLLFSINAIAVAAFAGLELIMMRAQTPEEYGLALRWLHIPTWFIVITLVWFVRLYLQAGRRWLAWTICGLRSLTVLLNFLFTPNLNYRAITGLKHLSWWGGETVSVGIGVTNPWTLVGQLSLLLLIVFAADATISVWRRGEHRRALVVGGSILFFTTVGAFEAILIVWGVLYIPLFVVFPYIGIVAAMAYELSIEMLQLAGALQASEAELRENQQRLDLAASSARIGLWMWDIASDEIWITDEGRSIFGFALDEKLNIEHLRSRTHPDDHAALSASVEATFRTGADYETEYRILRPDGQLAWIQGRGRVEFGPGGKPERMRGISTDVTERKRAEFDVQRHRDELAHLSRVSLMGELAASLAHELNQPLAGIISNASAGQRFIDSDQITLSELRELLGDIGTDGHRAGEVVRGIRNMVKKGEVIRQPMNLNAVVHDVVQIARADAALRSCEINLSLDPDLPSLEGDATQLRQVLLNLVINAFDAMRDTARAARKVEIATSSNGSGLIQTRVRDRGCGISEETRERLFEPFFTTKSEGLGMGLAIVRSIIESHGGNIAAENRPDGGADFYFTIAINPTAPKK